MNFLTFWLCFLCISGVLSFRDFKLEIPNGDNVPNPCKANTKWKAPGHLNILGGGKRNPFGQDFDKWGRTWNTDLCQADSDGDGMSNGEELGDKNCTWTKESGEPPSVTLLNSLSHPGICEPMDSPECQGKNADGLCEQDTKYECDFNIAGTDNEVSNITLQLTRTVVPAQETTYMCQSFSLDELLPDPTKPYHVVGSEPILDNENVMHHMIAYACADDNDQNIERLKTPGQCGMATSSSCQTSVGGWTVGSTGDCLLGDYGFKIGAGSYKYIILEMHWNNPLEHSGTTDSSGMKLYITPRIRRYDLGGLVVGPMNLRLEPGKDKVEQIGVCTPACTEQILYNKEINIISGNNHMHYLGREGHLEVLRNGEVVHKIAVDNEFEYDTPVSHDHDPPITIRAGDEIRMKCVYKTTSRTNTVFYGDGTQAEMCFGFITFYPNVLSVDESSCLDWNGIDDCGLSKRISDVSCKQGQFWSKNSTWIKMYTLLYKCELQACSQDCLDEIKSWYAEEPCLQDPSIRSYMIYTIGLAKTEEFQEAESIANMMRFCNKAYDEFIETSSTVTNSGFALMIIVSVVINLMWVTT